MFPKRIAANCCCICCAFNPVDNVRLSIERNCEWMFRCGTRQYLTSFAVFHVYLIDVVQLSVRDQQIIPVVCETHRPCTVFYIMVTMA